MKIKDDKPSLQVFLLITVQKKKHLQMKNSFFHIHILSLLHWFSFYREISVISRYSFSRKKKKTGSLFIFSHSFGVVKGSPVAFLSLSV